MTNRHFIELPNERTLPLPLTWCANEFSLPGNVEIHEGGRVVAVYDESTRTAAIWTDFPAPCWTIWQPMLREFFFSAFLLDYLDHWRVALANPAAAQMAPRAAQQKAKPEIR
jgi:hypothetical protein